MSEQPQELEGLLSEHGYRGFVSASPGSPILDRGEALEIDLLILDIDDALDDHAAMTMKTVQLASGRDAPVLALTVDPSSEKMQRALSAGVTDVLVKPFDPFEARTRVAALLGTRFLQMELTRQTDALENKVRVRTEELWATINRLERAHQDVRLAQEETITSLSIAAELRMTKRLVISNG